MPDNNPDDEQAPAELMPWQRRDDETDRAYEAFATYLGMGTQRTNLKVGEALGKTKWHMDTLSGRYQWVERVRAFDRYMGAVTTESYADMVRAVTDQQVTLIDKLFSRLNDSIDQLRPGDDPTIRWTQAFTAATKARTTLLDYNKPDAPKHTELSEKIAAILDKLGAE